MPRLTRTAGAALLCASLLLASACSGASEEDPSVPAVTSLPTDPPSTDTPETATPETPGPDDPSSTPPTEPATETEQPTTPPDDAATDAPTTPPAPEPGNLAAVTVTMSYWGADPADGSAFGNGYADTIETGATCTLVMTQGSSTVRAEASATADASTTSCGEMTVPSSELSPGTWSAHIEYTSPTSSGQSAPVEIVVP